MERAWAGKITARAEMIMNPRAPTRAHEHNQIEITWETKRKPNRAIKIHLPGYVYFSS